MVLHGEKSIIYRNVDTLEIGGGLEGDKKRTSIGRGIP